MTAVRKTPYVGVNMTVKARDQLRAFVLEIPQSVAGRRITISDAVRALVQIGQKDPVQVARVLAELARVDQKGQ